MASRRWRSPARNRQIFANDYGSGLFLLLLPPILALLCGPADQLFVDGRPQQQQHRHGNNENRANDADCGNGIGIKAAAENSIKNAKFGRQFKLEDPKQMEEVLKQHLTAEQMKGAFLEDYSKLPATPTTETPTTTLGGLAACQHQLELFVYPRGLYCKEREDGGPPCVPREPDGKCYNATLCFPSRTNANLTMKQTWVSEYCELHKPSAAPIHSTEGNNFVWHGIGAKICASKEADDIVVSLEMATTFTAEILNLDMSTARFSTEAPYPGAMAPYKEKNPLIIFNCNNNGISSSGDCNATLYNGPDNSRTNVGNKLSAITTNDLSIALCEIGNLSPEQMYFTENAGFRKCDAIIYWTMDGKRMRSKACTKREPKPPGIEDMFTKEEIEGYKQWIKEDREIMCKCLDKLQPPPPPGLVLPKEVVEQLNNKTRRNKFCLLAEHEVIDQDFFDRMPLPSVEDARKQLERKKKKCGLESKLNADAAKWTWKSVPHGDGWKWDYKKFPIKYSYASIGDDDDDKSYLDDIKDGIELISEQTCVKFAYSPLVGESEHYLFYYKGGGCFTQGLGIRATSETNVSIAEGCRVIGTVAHETMHALGFGHEQKRSDRDDYVWVHFEAIEEDHQGQYEIWDNSDNLNLGYDFGSVMHYPDWGFKVKNYNFTMYALVRAYQRTMGQRSAISFKDAKGINTVYCNHICQRQRDERGSDICQNGGYLDPKNCERCKCPDGYGGEVCQDVAKSDTICGALNNELVAKEKNKVYEFKFESKGKGRCYVRVWPKMPMNRVWITITEMKGFECEKSPNYVEIKYKADKAVTGPRVRCIEKDFPQKDYKFDADANTEIVLIFNVRDSGLTVNFQYGGGGDVLGELKESCECTFPGNLFVPKRNPGMEVTAFYFTHREHECDGKPSGSWQLTHGTLQCNPWKGVYTLVNGKYRTHRKTDVVPSWNTSDVRPKESAILMDCKILSNGQSVWIYEDDKFGLVLVDDFMCIRRDA